MKPSMKKMLTFLGLTFASLVWANIFVASVSASEMSYSVETVLPDNQIDKKNSYFDLKMAPHQKQELRIHMRNDTAKAVKVTPTVSPATTNSNGVVEYGPAPTKLNDTASYNIKDLIKSSTKEITIPAHSDTDYTLNVTMPEKAYDGVVAGGIYFEEKDQKSGNSQQKSGLALENRFSYVVAILLKETDRPVTPELTLEEVAPGQINARNVINADLKNTQATYINQLKVDTAVKAKNSKEVLYKSSKSAMQVAPNTTFTYPTALNGDTLKPGDYTMHVVASSGKHRWEFDKDFTISGEKAQELNKKDVSIKHNSSWLYILLGLLLLVLAFCLLLFVLWKKRKKKIETINDLKQKLEKAEK